MAQVGGSLKIVYENIKHGIHLEQQDLAVCPKNLQRKATVHIINVQGSQLQDAAVQALIPEMQNTWAQWCVSIQTDFAHFNPANASLSTPAFKGSYTLPPFTYTITTTLPDGTKTTQTKTVTLSSATGAAGLSQDTIDLISQSRPEQARMTGDANGEITILVIDHLTNTGIGPINGITLTDSIVTATGPTGPRPLPKGFGGIIFLTTNATENVQQQAKFQMNSKTIAHELAHMILDRAHSDEGCPTATVVCDKRNLLSATGAQPDNNLLRRRFTSDQIQLVRDGHRRHLQGVQ